MKEVGNGFKKLPSQAKPPAAAFQTPKPLSSKVKPISELRPTAMTLFGSLVKRACIAIRYACSQ
jgi:hypothetical protein